MFRHRIYSKRRITFQCNHFITFRNSHPEVFLRKGALKICRKFTGEHPCQSVISIKLQRIFIEITLRHGCSPVNLLHVFRTPFPRNTSGWLLLHIPIQSNTNRNFTLSFLLVVNAWVGILKIYASIQ